MQPYQIRRFLLFALFLFVSIMVILGSEYVGARTIFVDDDGGYEYRNIQEALDDAEEGDVIHVYEGIYQEHIVVNKTVTLEGSGSGGTVIDGGGTGCVVTIENQANNVNISGFTITGSGETWLDDCGIKTHSDSNQFLECVITECRIGIRLHYSDKNLIANSSCRDNDYGVYLGFSTRNTLSRNNMSGNSHFGIYLANSHENEVRQNDISNDTHVLGVGIQLRWSENNTIIDNVLNGNLNYGVHLSDNSHNNTIQDNTCNDNDRYGIYIANSEDVLVMNNNCNNNSVGIHLYSAARISIQNNTLRNNIEDGIAFRFSQECELSGNTMVSNGIGIRDGTINYWNSHSITQSNSVNGRPVIYMVNISGEAVPSNAGQIIMVNCSMISLHDRNITGGSMGILASYSHNITITDSTFSANTRSIMVYSSENITLSDCTMLDSLFGVYLGKCHDILLDNIQCVANSYGVFMFSCSDVLLESCNLTGNHYCGCKLSSSSSISIHNCTVENNGDGLRFYLSDNNIISGNSVCNNLDRGIDLWDSSDNIFEMNLIQNNDDFGIYLAQYSKGNCVHRNEITGNQQYGITAEANVYNSINATNNWWGHASGPYHPVNYLGTGDRVTEYVKYDPWMMIPDGYDLPVAVIQSVNPDPGVADEAVTFQGMERDGRDVDIYEWKTDEVVLYRGPQSSFSTDFLSGNYNISYRIMDNLGVWSEIVNVSVQVHDRPVAEISMLKGIQTYTTATVFFMASVIDDGHIVQYIWNSSIDGALYNGTSDQFNITNLSSGQHLITLRVVDDMGALSQEEEYILQINIFDIEPPEITILSPVPNEVVQGTIIIRGEAIDDVGVQLVLYRTDNTQLWSEANGDETWSFQVNTKELEEGYCSIWVKAYDGKHYSETRSVVIIVDNDQVVDSEPPPEKPPDETDFEKYYYAMVAVVLIAVVMINVYVSYLEEVEAKEKLAGEQRETNREGRAGDQER